MTTPSELYQGVILDHNRAPRNFRPMPEATGHGEGYNPLCGDQLSVWLRQDGEQITDVSFQGSGCAISKAAASLMTTVVKGKTRAEASAIFDSYHRMVTGRGGPADDLPPKLAIFAGVREFPARVKCATLAWHALKAAMDEGGGAPGR
ncbi:MAG: SUF system NifU family Fe-S cluster assembly protein [Gemmatimonadota bacterium]|nr:SUF system NifU family Fe-S cluster assembly protein [Gemmatimonadota bacterium]MDH4348191.1 SUF system NifU family Fe-S cluster assembly protein [Gemmatimonadota bacterium]MDH5284589.1 SUF system NifU family Fe-S cluster assembly protein [Gemmatimonadota bacterium]